MKINWEIFFDNSSTVDAIIDFINGNYTFKQFENACWTKDCKIAIRCLKSRGYKKSFRSARHAIKKFGYSIED